MRNLTEIDDPDQYPLEKRVSVFMRNDRESPKGQRPLPNNQNSYVLRDVYQFEDETGYFGDMMYFVYTALVREHNSILEIRCLPSNQDGGKIWNWFVKLFHLPRLFIYSKYCYGWAITEIYKKIGETETHPCYIERGKLSREEKMKKIAWPYYKTIYYLERNRNAYYSEMCCRWLFERERDAKHRSWIEYKVLMDDPQVDPRGPGMRIYPHYTQFDHLEGEELVKAYLESEPMMELILARCEQEVEIRINESLISVEEVIERIRKGLEPMQWRLEVRL